MLIILDTHTFVWWRTDDRRLSALASRTIERAARLGLPGIVLWEIAMLVDSGIIRFSSTTGRWLSDALSDGRIEVLGISPEVAVRAIDVGRAIRQDPADHLVGATALVLNAPLVTRDSAFERMPGLQVIW